MKTTNKGNAKLAVGYVRVSSSGGGVVVRDEKLLMDIRSLLADYESRKRSELIKRARLNKNK